jgi:hypothetical protein
MGDTAGRDINKIYNTGDNVINTINTGTPTIDSAFNELKQAINRGYTGSDKAIVYRRSKR